MIEYKSDDAQKIGEAIKTLVFKCAECKGTELDCIIELRGLMLDCHFEFHKHETE